MASRILVIEDERKTAAFLRRGLTENGFAVEVCSDGAAGLAKATADEFDLIILDVMLPDLDGWSVISELRRAGRPTPVLFLTARDNVRDRVKGFHLGADDYLVKPFAFSELLARVQSVLRRTAASSVEMISVADLEINLVQQRVSRGGQRVELTPKEFALLVLLGRSKGRPVSRTQIAREVWEVEHEGESNVVDVHVRRLRSKIDEPFDRKLIHTVRGIGYVLEDRP